MLVEINLLPKKEQKNYKLITILLAALFIMIVAGFVLFWQGKSYNQEISSLDNQISTTQQIAQLEQAKVMEGQVSGSVSVLESAVLWASEDPLKTVPIIEHVTALLPQRGFIQNISYAETGSVSMTVQFDTSREAAYYLKTLLDSEWFSEVKLSSVSTSELETESTDSQTEQQEDKDQATNTESQEGKAYLIQPDGTVTQVQVQSETPKENETTVVEPEKDLVPRYIGQFQLQLSRDYINAQQNGADKVAATEGGEES
ncbi:MAG: PilN domain-containing protein [Bacillota bacterium]